MILCYIYENMAEFEITWLLKLINSGKKEVTFVSEEVRLVKSQSGFKYMPDKKISDVKDISGYEALIIPGGPIDNGQNEICGLLKQFDEAGKLIAAICFAPQFLGRAGILDRHKFTTSCSEKKIEELGVSDPFNRKNYVHRRVVTDGNVITAQGFSFVDFAVEVCRYLNILDEEQLMQQLKRVKSEEI